MTKVESISQSNLIEKDEFISHEIGKLVTVIKDTGVGIP